jgi:hypothetical protein
MGEKRGGGRISKGSGDEKSAFFERGMAMMEAFCDEFLLDWLVCLHSR